MNLVLTGFMGTGKTAVGRRLAELLKVPFVDVDALIVKTAGRPIADIFAGEGEAAFRELETRIISEVAAQDRTVIATGGGALLDAKNRENLQRAGILVCLTARMGTLFERLKDDWTRPMLAGENLKDKIERLMGERQAVYSLCPIQVSTDDKTIAQVAEEIIQKISPQWQSAS